MAATRDEARRASAYVASDKPLFVARDIPKKYFTKAAKPGESAESSPPSRIPRRASSLESVEGAPNAVTIKGAYERAVMEEKEAIQVRSQANSAGVAGEGSPSPAPRVRDGAVRRERDKGRMGRLTKSPSRRVGASSPQRATEEDPASGSESGGSVSGSLHGAGDMSDDDLDMKLMDHARDQERAHALLKSQKGLFTRGNVGSRVTETAHTLVRKTSGSGPENEPGVKIPKTWGSKAKKTRGAWLSRNIFSPDSSGEVNGLPPAAIPEAPIDWAGAAADIPLPSVEDSSSIQEPTPPHSRPSSAQPIITSPQKSQMWDADLEFTARSLQISTSPQLKIRSSKLDDIRAREIESLNKRAVATSRLEEIKERVSLDRSEVPEVTIKEGSVEVALVGLRAGSGPSSGTRDSESAQIEAYQNKSSNAQQDRVLVSEDASESLHEVSKTLFPGNRQGGASSQDNMRIGGKEKSTERRPKSPNKQETSRKGARGDSVEPSPSPQEYDHGKTILEEEGEHIADTPITIFKGAARHDKREAPQEHKLEDSWEVLHRLSKIASPSPNRADGDGGSDESPKQNNGLQVSAERISGASTPPKSDVDPEERIAAEASLFELPDNKSERNSLRAPSPIEASNEDTPHPKTDPLSLPTPVVTGAYIDTPAPFRRRSRITREASPPSDWSDTAKDAKPRLTSRGSGRTNISHTNHSSGTLAIRPSKDRAIAPSSPNKVAKALKPKARSLSRTLVNTAKPASARDDLRRIQREAQVEDSTLDDFDQLLAVECDEPDPNSTTIIEQPMDLQKDANGMPLSQKERERLQEMRAYERMNKTLKIASLNIRDAKRGIERLEDRVSYTLDPISQQPPSATFNHTTCASCASPNMVYHLTIPVPRLWWRDSTKWLGIRFTWLGFIVALFLTWVISESITCEYICHPKYASQNDWSVRDPFWGWALPTLIDRWTAGVFSLVWRCISGLLVWVWEMWTSSSNRYSSSPRAGSAYRVPRGMEWDAGQVWSEGSILEDETI